MARIKGALRPRRFGPKRGRAAVRENQERLKNISRDPNTTFKKAGTETKTIDLSQFGFPDGGIITVDVPAGETTKKRNPLTGSTTGSASGNPKDIIALTTEDATSLRPDLTLEGIAALDTDLRNDFSDVPGGISGVLRAREELERRGSLDDRRALEEIQAGLIAKGASEEDILRASQDLIRKVEKDESVRQQTEAEALAQRTLIREKQALERAGVELDLQGAELGRQEKLLKQSLQDQFAQLDFAESELGRQETTLAREAASTRRQGALAARSAQASVAQAANIAAQSGFKSSALAGLSASAQAQASTQAGDILTGLVGIGQQQESLAGKQDLLSLEREGVTLRGEAAASDLLAAGRRLELSREQLGETGREIAFEQQRLAQDLQSNLDFIQETFTIGGDINRFSEQLALEKQAAAERQAQRQGLVSGITTGASLGSSFGPQGAVIGGIAGGVLSLL